MIIIIIDKLSSKFHTLIDDFVQFPYVLVDIPISYVLLTLNRNLYLEVYDRIPSWAAYNYQITSYSYEAIAIHCKCFA